MSSSESSDDCKSEELIPHPRCNCSANCAVETIYDLSAKYLIKGGLKHLQQVIADTCLNYPASRRTLDKRFSNQVSEICDYYPKVGIKDSPLIALYQIARQCSVSLENPDFSHYIDLICSAHGINNEKVLKTHKCSLTDVDLPTEMFEWQKFVNPTTPPRNLSQDPSSSEPSPSTSSTSRRSELNEPKLVSTLPITWNEIKNKSKVINTVDDWFDDIDFSDDPITQRLMNYDRLLKDNNEFILIKNNSCQRPTYM